jgi:GTP pyrophosphokinase
MTAEIRVTAPDYLKPGEAELFLDALAFAQHWHEGQKRADGQPYVSHPLAVAQTLAGWRVDIHTLAAALLHDVVEDTGATREEIAQRYGETVASLVDGVTKLDKIHFENKTHAQAENFRKMLLAMSRDVRVILIKLADRLHNMNTLDAVPLEKRQRIARETQEIFIPIANRLGFSHLYSQLEDLAFRYLHPTRHRVLERALSEARGDRQSALEKIKDEISTKISAAGLAAEVFWREKHLASIYRKMHEKHLSFAEIYDVFGFRILTDSLLSCYTVLGILHGMYKPIPGKFKDYIAMPKANGYQSLHTTLFGPFGAPIEIQIRSREMHQIAETGIAAHWMYKSSANELLQPQLQNHKWLQNLLDIQADSRDSAEFLEHIKVDLFPDAVYVFTPKGKILSLPRGATAIDFAYAVHTDIGNHCAAARINGEYRPLSTPISNGDRVEIITDELARPHPNWIHYAFTGRARAQIRNHLRNRQQNEATTLGEKLLYKALRGLAINPSEIGLAQWEALTRAHGRSQGDILADIGMGKILAIVVARQLQVRDHDSRLQTSPGPLLISGAEGFAVRLGKCCHPIPGDPIIGQIKKDQGLIIHAHECPQVRHYREDPDKWVDVDWASDIKRVFSASICVTTINQRGMLGRIASAIANEGSNIEDVHMDDPGGSYTRLYFNVQVKNNAHLFRLIRALRSLPDVTRIQRFRGNIKRHLPSDKEAFT